TRLRKECATRRARRGRRRFAVGSSRRLEKLPTFCRGAHTLNRSMNPDPTKAPPEEWLAHSRWLSKLARSLVVEEATADDLVQQTWFAALRNPPQRGRPARPWLARVLRNFAVQHRRS